MVNIVCGAVAVIGAISFLYLYLARIPSVAFWVVTVVCLALAAADVILTVRAERARDNHNGAS